MAPFLASVRTHWCAALLIGVAGAAPAHAQQDPKQAPVGTLSDKPAGPELAPGEADRKARSLFEQGRVAYEEGRYRDSWDYFRQAYLLSKRPELLYNVGQSADRLRMDREALEAFRLYLARLPNAHNRREVENRVRALEERIRQEEGGPQHDPAARVDPAYSLDEGQPAAQTPAAPEQEPEAEAEAESAQPSGGQPERTGWYLQFGLGIGLLGDSIGNLREDTTLSSATGVGHAALGYDINEGIVVGGGLVFDWSFSPSANFDGGGSVDLDAANLTMLMAFLDWYLNPRTEGWHLLGGLAFATLALSDQTATVGVKDAHGGALIVGAGHQWPLDSEWALGVLGRLVLAKVDQDTGKHALGALSVSATATWY